VKLRRRPRRDGAAADAGPTPADVQASATQEPAAQGAGTVAADVATAGTAGTQVAAQEPAAGDAVGGAERASGREIMRRAVVSRADSEQAAAMSGRLAALIERSPAVRDLAVEVGVVDAEWLAQPDRRKPTIAPPVEVLRRFLERTVERYPSALGSVGLNALQVLSWDLYWDRGLRGGRSRDTMTVATVVFTDLEGFTSYTARFGDEAALALLAEHHRVTAPIVRKWGGRVVKHLGDGLMLAFPSGSGAVHAALELVPTAAEPLRMRAGVHTGELVVTTDDLVGNVVNIAARVAAAADGGEVLATTDTIAAAGDLGPGVRVLRARRRTLKGVTDRVSVSRVEPVAQQASAAGRRR
jgi:adenylate cyclase